ncbi:FlgB family protein [Oceanicella actignis]|uniref:Flagellar basal-body rod protein FlgB n=1 Tax=Oceanicella actignis TaxID=1189325 RepID=A0A1M7T483_9RHOB|nr:FlgB family protein [Oceanicella actignis]SET41390.1 flagellar basal-body rod protein FlgB [Oceanicella actignis]SHN65565.1 flagellar basal-body rod protein FlgB [Oceanicella actignis]
MPTGLKVLDLAQKLAGHAAARQTVISRNIANADTPGYKALDLKPFSETYAARAAMDDQDAFAPRATRPGHVGYVERDDPADLRARRDSAIGAASPNGNDVSLEDQMIRAAELRLEHDLALGVWRKSLDVLRTALGRAR